LNDVEEMGDGKDSHVASCLDLWSFVVERICVSLVELGSTAEKNANGVDLGLHLDGRGSPEKSLYFHIGDDGFGDSGCRNFDDEAWGENRLPRRRCLPRSSLLSSALANAVVDQE
jgi:hypothetical protein